MNFFAVARVGGVFGGRGGLAERWTAHATGQDHNIFIALAELLASEVLEDIGLQLGARAEQARCIAA